MGRTNMTQVLIGEERTFRGVLRASALALALMDLSLGPAMSVMTLALPYLYNASVLLCPAISNI